MHLLQRLKPCCLRRLALSLGQPLRAPGKPHLIDCTLPLQLALPTTTEAEHALL